MNDYGLTYFSHVAMLYGECLDDVYNRTLAWGIIIQLCPEINTIF